MGLTAWLVSSLVEYSDGDMEDLDAEQLEYAMEFASEQACTYTMKHKYRRTWLLFLLYLLNITRVNSYVAHRELGGEMSHMGFALGVALDLWARRSEGAVRTRGAESSSVESRQPVFKRMRQHLDPLPEAHLQNPERHKASFY